MEISLKFVPKVRINNIPALVRITAWRRSGDKPLSAQIMICFTDEYMRHSASMSQYSHTQCVNKIGRVNNTRGAVSIRKTVFPGMAIPMLKIRRPSDRLIFNMEIAIRR